MFGHLVSREKTQDKRLAKRVSVGFDLLFKVGGSNNFHLEFGKKEICTHMFNISQGGISIWTTKPISVGTELNITFHVIFKEGQTHPIYAKCRIMYCSLLPDKKRYRLGLKFIEIPPQDLDYVIELVRIKSEETK